MTTETWLLEEYFEWLRNDAFTIRSERREYEGALRVLNDIPFYWTLPSDENRAGDALSFRQYEFLPERLLTIEEANQSWVSIWAEASPSVLEVLVGIARRWSIHFEGAVPFYFGHLWKNMEFDRHPGRHLTGASLEAIRLKVDDWMSRQFQPNGQGSPFYIGQRALFLDGTLDMTVLDIWAQMNVYSAVHFQ